MSSNISIPKICNHCGKSYIAHRTTTRYCSLICNSRDYKLKVKQEKIKNTLIEQQNIICGTPDNNVINPNSLLSKNYLSIQDTADLIGVSRWTINRMVKRGELQIHKFGRKKIIQKSQIEILFKS
jgi:excisionase family DNA binding protein